MESEKIAALKTSPSPSTNSSATGAPTASLASASSGASRPPTVDQQSFSCRADAAATETSATEAISIQSIESSLSPLRIAEPALQTILAVVKRTRSSCTSFTTTRAKVQEVQAQSKKARAGEFYHLADMLLRMAGGSAGERKKQEDKVIISIGMGRFQSTSRLSSLHGTFESFFVNLVSINSFIVKWLCRPLSRCC